MAANVKTYSTYDNIVDLLDSQPDSDAEAENTKSAAKTTRKRNSKLQKSMQNIIANESSDTENMFDHVKYSLPQKIALQRENASLRIKLRRSSEQSLYKIDTDSDSERPVRKSRVAALKKIRSNSTDVGSDASCSDNKDSTMNNKRHTKDQIAQRTQDENITPSRSNRIRRPPLRLSYYQCGTLPSQDHLKNSPQGLVRNSPSLRNKKSINYNEDKLLIEHIKDSIINREKATKLQKKSKGYNSDSSVSSTGSKTFNSPERNSKKHCTTSMQDNKINTSTHSEVTRTKSSSKPNVVSNGTGNTKEFPIDSTLEKTRAKNKLTASNSTTPVRTDRLKRRSVMQNIRKEITVNNEESDEDSLADVHKRVRSLSINRNALTPRKKSNFHKQCDLQAEETYFGTPKSRALKCSSLTPSIGQRSTALLKPSTPLQEARSRLHVSAVPKSLPCREEEFNNIFTFLKGKLVDKSGGCIYISGVPGTGKTATVNEVVRCLQKLILRGELGAFDYVTINGMKLTEPRQSYVQILKQLTGQTVTWEQAYRTLEKRFHNANSKMTLLLVDELDYLCTKRQDVVYNLLDWPTKATAQLVVITIANTMDLPERVLMGRVTSRLGLTRLTFQPYNYKQLQEIVVTRLKDFNGFRSEAIQLVARKVSAVSGDARRALDICRRAMEIAESRNGETISLQDVTQAVSEMIASAKIQAIKHCSKMEQIFLQAVSAEVTRTSVEEVYFKDAYRQLESLCSFDGIKVPTVTEVLAVCGRLGASRILICEHSRNDIYQKILLNVSTDDIHYALQELDLNAKS